MSNEKNKLFIGNLAWKCSEDDLRTLFEQHGTVVDVKIVLDNMTGKSRGFAFVTMGSDEEALAAIDKLNNFPIQGRDLRVSLAEEQRREKREPRAGGAGGFQRREGGGGRDGGFRGGNSGGRGGDRGGHRRSSEY